MAAAQPDHLFASSPGQVLVYKADELVTATLSVDGLTNRNGAFDVVKSVVTSIGLNESVNAQFSPSLSRLVYVYTFGDKPAAFEINGLHVSNPCDGGPSGFELMHQYWRRNRMSSRRTPIGITIGTRVAIRGFLTDISLGTGDVQSGVGPFRLMLTYMPTDGVV